MLLRQLYTAVLNIARKVQDMGLELRIPRAAHTSSCAYLELRIPRETGQIRLGDARLRDMNPMFFLRAFLFTLAALIACVVMPFLLVQYPLVGIVVVAAGIYLFSRSFAQRKKFQ